MNFLHFTSLWIVLLSWTCCGPPFSTNRLLVLLPFTLTLLHFCLEDKCCGDEPGGSITIGVVNLSGSLNDPPRILFVDGCPRDFDGVVVCIVIQSIDESPPPPPPCPRRFSDMARGDLIHVIVVGTNVFADDTDLTTRFLLSRPHAASLRPNGIVNDLLGQSIVTKVVLIHLTFLSSISSISWFNSRISWSWLFRIGHFRVSGNSDDTDDDADDEIDGDSE